MGEQGSKAGIILSTPYFFPPLTGKVNPCMDHPTARIWCDEYHSQFLSQVAAMAAIVLVTRTVLESMHGSPHRQNGTSYLTAENANSSSQARETLVEASVTPRDNGAA